MDLPEGWRTEVRKRQTTDKYYYAPCGKRFRTQAAVREFLKLPPAKRQATRQTSYMKGQWSGKNQFACTPDDVLEWARKKLGGDFFDPCPENPTFDGLSVPWKERNFINPPYKNIEPWLRKAVEEHAKGNSSLFLLPARISPFWWHDHCMRATEIWFVCSGIRFRGYKNRCPFDVCLVYFDASQKLDSPKVRSCEFHRPTRFPGGVLDRT